MSVWRLLIPCTLQRAISISRKMENRVKDEKTEDLRVKKKILNFLSQRSQQNKIPLWLQTPYRRHEKQRRAGHIHGKTISWVWSYNPCALLNESGARALSAAHTTARLAVGSHLGASTVGTFPLPPNWWGSLCAQTAGTHHVAYAEHLLAFRVFICAWQSSHMTSLLEIVGAGPCDLPVGTPHVFSQLGAVGNHKCLGWPSVEKTLEGHAWFPLDFTPYAFSLCWFCWS